MIQEIDEQRARQINRNSVKWRAVPTEDGKFKVVKKRYFDAALANRLTADWKLLQGSADEVLRYELKTLIHRSRELEINNQYVNGFFMACERNIVGDGGIKLSMQVREPDGKGGYKIDQTASQAIEDAWRVFRKKKNFLVTQDMSDSDVQRLVVRSVFRDGGVLGRKIRGKEAGNPFNFAIQLFEIDHLDADYNEAYNGNEVRMGVERDKFRRVVAYHLLTDHPGDLTYGRRGRNYMRIPAEEIIHPFNKMRINQARGYPMLASSMAGLKMLLGYKEAELIAARAAANIGNFLRDPDGIGSNYDNDSMEQFNPEALTPMEPGMDKYIGGLEVVPNNPNHPVAAFGDFLRESLRGCAVSVGMSHHNFSGDMAGVTYSSARIAELNERDQWKIFQRFFSENWENEIFEEWLQWALAYEQIKLPSGRPLPLTKFEKFNQPVWRARRWQWVDPLKEANAAEKWTEMNVISTKQIIEENGRDEDEVYLEIAEGKRKREELGLVPEMKEAVEDPNEDPDAEDNAEAAESAQSKQAS